VNRSKTVSPRARLIKLRKARGLTQAAMAAQLGIPRSTYAMIEIGRREPWMDLQKRMADFFDETVDALFFTPDGHVTRPAALAR
jgi:transcriptional regulator with XRE-family HTH domain